MHSFIGNLHEYYHLKEFVSTTTFYKKQSTDVDDKNYNVNKV